MSTGRPAGDPREDRADDGREPRPAGTGDWNPWWYNQEHDQPYHFHLPVNPGLLRIEPGRLRRARKLWCFRLRGRGPRKYAVQGSREIMFVDMHGDEPCYCEDALLDDEPWVCKHILRVLIKERHPKVLAFMSEEDEMDETRNRWAGEAWGVGAAGEVGG